MTNRDFPESPYKFSEEELVEVRRKARNFVRDMRASHERFYSKPQGWFGRFRLRVAEMIRP